MTTSELAQQIVTAHPVQVATRNGSRPARVSDVQRAAKAAARELGLTGIDAQRFYLAATRAALGRADISAVGFGR